MRLGPTLLDRLPPEVARPAYDRDRHGVGIVHLGVGAFHRAHQAAYVDDVLAREGGDWRILGVSLRSPTARDQLMPQGGLYSVAEGDVAGERRRVIGAVASVLVAPEEPEAVLRALARPGTSVITLTVTEKGYCHDPATGRLDPEHPDVKHDLTYPGRPRSVPGYLVEALARRRAAGVAAPTLLSCDNLSNNGATMARVLVDLARRRDPALAAWIEAEVAFPSTMVDRIVPAVTAADKTASEEALGCRDEGTVSTEPFRQWVIEDRFAGRRPELEAAGAQLVADVRPFELAKLRMLNAAHSLLAYLGLLAGYEHVHEAIEDAELIDLTRRLMLEEAAPTLPRAAGLEPASYTTALLTRFANPMLRHRLAQIASDGSQKLPQRVVGTIRENLAAGRPIDVATLTIAAWIVFVSRRNRVGRPFEDPLASQLAAIAAGETEPEGIAAAFLAIRPVFGDLGEVRPVRDAVAGHLRRIMADGIREAMHDTLHGLVRA